MENVSLLLYNLVATKVFRQGAQLKKKNTL